MVVITNAIGNYSTNKNFVNTRKNTGVDRIFDLC